MIVWDDTPLQPLQSHWATEIPLVRPGMSCAQLTAHSEGGGKSSQTTVGRTPMTRSTPKGFNCWEIGGGGGGGGDI